ncbi:MAG: iron-sulfur cluster assembly scaffold protein [Clostridiales bacterium]|jgi:nitrogen fixation NifU-like protein|nr:iron-sulfur cluster assembly scaffold protein [Clostridiales bacterium]MDR2711634.1 iron-sulfur cluster assembly scaffold protein [Clostridiales bacterium]
MNDYNAIVMDHFQNPRNVGEGQRQDGVGVVKSPACGDTTCIYLDVEDNIIRNIQFKTFGCAAAIASSSVLTEMVKGKTLDEAKNISTQQLVDELGGLPPVKIHCSVLAADALKAAIEDYEKKLNK